jgi:hypothetical protein
MVYSSLRDCAGDQSCLRNHQLESSKQPMTTPTYVVPDNPADPEAAASSDRKQQ